MATIVREFGTRVIGGALKKRHETLSVGSGDNFPVVEGFSKRRQQQMTARVDSSSPIVASWKKNFGIGKKFECFNFTSK